MATLIIPDKQTTLTVFDEIRDYLDRWGILLEQWEAAEPLSLDPSPEQILSAYRHKTDPYMQTHGYQTKDVISVTETTPNLDDLRAKFLREHTHTEDEIRFFIDGQGDFWFNPGGDELVFCVHCTSGDFLSVPAGVNHWFDMGRPANVKVIRIFTDVSGWTPHYTDSGIEQRYLGASV